MQVKFLSSGLEDFAVLPVRWGADLDNEGYFAVDLFSCHLKIIGAKWYDSYITRLSFSPQAVVAQVMATDTGSVQY